MAIQENFPKILQFADTYLKRDALRVRVNTIMSVENILKNTPEVNAWSCVLSLAAVGAFKSEIRQETVLEFLTASVTKAHSIPSGDLRSIVENTSSGTKAENRERFTLIMCTDGDESFTLSVEYAAHELDDLGFGTEQIVQVLDRGIAELLQLRDGA
jgi:hypothetical protein